MSKEIHGKHSPPRHRYCKQTEDALHFHFKLIYSEENISTELNGELNGERTPAGK